MFRSTFSRLFPSFVALVLTFALGTIPALAADRCAEVELGDAAAMHAALKAALTSAIAEENGGLNNNMWGTIVDADGVVCAIAFTGANRFEQWPGSRVIAAQKANTAAAFNLPGGTRGLVDAISTANLWGVTQPGASLFGLQFSNPVSHDTAYGSNTPINPFSTPTQEADNYGMVNDPLAGQFVGGINVFGGGLGLFLTGGWKAGGIGVSGDTSCADHNIAWRVRNTLNLDNLVIGGVGGLNPPPMGDNIIYDLDASGKSASGFGHPICGFGEDAVTLPPNR